MSMAIVGVFAFLAWSPWLRPPLHHDLRGTQVPWAISAGSELDPAILGDPVPMRADSVAGPILIVCVLGAIAVGFSPRQLSPLSGAVAALALAGTCAALLNHPTFVESLCFENAQRQHLRQTLGNGSELIMTGMSPSRVNLPWYDAGILEISKEPDNLSNVLMYSVWSLWLIVIASIVVLATTGGSMGRRACVLCGWLMVGAIASTAVCHRRIVAEWRWDQAEADLRANRFDDAEQTIDQLLAGMPDFGQTVRLFQFQGELDLRRGRPSPAADAFVASQQSLSSGADAVLEKVVTQIPNNRSVREFAAQVYFEQGRLAELDGRTAASQRLWERGFTLAPWRLDCRVSHALATEQLEAAEPEQVEALLAPIISEVGDRILRADLQAVIGDAYFEAGQPVVARRFYAQSMDTFTLPRAVNPYAQEALLGM